MSAPGPDAFVQPTEGMPAVLPAEPARDRPGSPSRGRVRVSVLGPAFVAAVAYIDPGNFATNVQGGAKFGYQLLWVVLAANLVAMLVQYLSAKLGAVTGLSLPEQCRARLPRWASVGMWVQAELIAMATDIAEFLGAAIGLNLLFGVPLLIAGLLTGVIAFSILALQRRGYRSFELAIAALLGIVLAGFLYETLHIGPSARASLHGLIPSLHGASAAYLAVGIIGATVMPHVIYLHSAMTTRSAREDAATRRRVLRLEAIDVVVALTIAGLINLAMLAVAAKLLHVPGLMSVDTITGAHRVLLERVGGGAALAFAMALLASGASSSSVGTYAGQIVMAGFLGVRIPLLVRRAITMLPALVILATGVSTTGALVLSQVVLSFGIPFALIPLVVLTGKRSVMGADANGPGLRIAGYLVAAAISAMNVFLVVQAL
ncbi:MAG TPA: Nramp family divalent metal transporter [Solirubrobacteraceae bacterium]|nr:Nramp family divalent metal transporter [Solirubrobacteraceae bacterium]